MKFKKVHSKGMKIVALTGGIATGKSTVARQFQKLGAALYDADRIVHDLLGQGGLAVAKVATVFPETLVGQAIERKKLGEAVFGQPEKLRQLETMLHPLIWTEEAKFLAQAKRRGAKLCVLEIPLLFEAAAKKKLDAVVTTTAPKFLQKRRAMLRPGMTERKLAAILQRQMPDHEKRRRADVVIHTGLGKAYSFREVKKAIFAMRKRNPNA